MCPYSPCSSLLKSQGFLSWHPRYWDISGGSCAAKGLCCSWIAWSSSLEIKPDIERIFGGRFGDLDKEHRKNIACEDLLKIYIEICKNTPDVPQQRFSSRRRISIQNKWLTQQCLRGHWPTKNWKGEKPVLPKSGGAKMEGTSISHAKLLQFPSKYLTLERFCNSFIAVSLSSDDLFRSKIDLWRPLFCVSTCRLGSWTTMISLGRSWESAWPPSYKLVYNPD